MKKMLAGILVAATAFSMVGCGGSSTKETQASSTEAASETEATSEGGAYTLGMGVVTSTGSSSEGKAQIDATVAAVILDAEGKIVSCQIDVAQNKMDVTDGIVADDVMEAAYPTKKEKKEDYNMKGASPIGKEWYEQIAVFEEFVVGKTVDEVLAIPTEVVDNHTITTDETLYAGCTMSIADFIVATEKACNDEYARAFEGEGTLSLALISSTNSATASAADGEDGTAAIYTNCSAVVVDASGVILSNVYDEIQPKVTFNELGEITSDAAEVIRTKREKHDDYGMLPVSAIGKEWYDQAAAFEEYVIGKTAAEVSAIETVESDGHNIPADETLAASCSMSIGGMIEAVAKAATIQ